MGFWYNLADSYDKNAGALKSRYPLSTTTISNVGDMIAVITIDVNGNFIEAEKIEKAKKSKSETEIIPVVQICIPVSEKSMGRSSGISPHPVFDQYEYLMGCGNKFEAYLAELEKFAISIFSTPQIKAIYQYIVRRTVKTDLEKVAPKDKTNIVFKVEIRDNPQSKVWEDTTFFDAWHQYYLSEKKLIAEKKIFSGNEPSVLKKKKKEAAEQNEKLEVDYVTGTIVPVAVSHPKKISNASANSKLVSDNDKTNFTFRGKFSESSEAVAIGYESSQKAHQFLRYLINDRGRGFYCGEQVILSFTIGSTEKLLQPPIEEKSIWALLQETTKQTEQDAQITLSAETGLDYAEALRKSLAGFGYEKTLQQHAATAVVALDAATTGRLSITFYRELGRNEYIESIAEWHASCKWNQQFWNNENKQFIYYTGAPSADRIIEAVYGKPRGNNDESYKKIKKAARERLLRCVFDRAFLPSDYVAAAVHRSSNPLAVTVKGKFDRNGFNQLLSTTCALIRKNHQQHTKEEYKLSIELERTDRDYLYGRLLGAADKLESRALKDKDRVTAAVRYMQAFAQRPFRAWQTIHSCLNPYIQTFRNDFAYNEIQAIMQLFKASDYEVDTPLSGSYLIGYYHERAYIDNLVKAAAEKKKTT